MIVLIVKLARPRVQCRAHTEYSNFTKQCKHKAPEGYIFCKKHYNESALYLITNTLKNLIYDSSVGGLSHEKLIENVKMQLNIT